MKTPRLRTITTAFALLLAGIVTTSGAVPAAAEAGTQEDLRIAVPAGPGETGIVDLDATIFIPDSTPAPAVILAHGFGGSKRDLRGQARELQAAGYVVLTYSARGFGDSTGRISLDSVDHEVADGRALVDLLARRPEVRVENGDPQVGVAGASYGGALALMLGATDPRIDAVVAVATWNSLGAALVPGADDNAQTGVFKQAWASRLFSAATSRAAGPCGSFTAQFCAVYSDLVDGEPLSTSAAALLEASSPASVLGGMTAPTLLLQGTSDTLFGLDQADANARQIEGAGARVQVRWFDGGHDKELDPGGTSDAAAAAWFTSYLPVHGAAPAAASGSLPFDYTVPATSTSFARIVTAPSYPGLDGSGSGASMRTISLHGAPRNIINPPGGLPAAVTTLPGLSAALAQLGPASTRLQPGQSARFVSDPLVEPLTVVGAAAVTLTVARAPGAASDPAGGDALLFVSMYDVGDGNRILPGGAVTPVRLTDLPADGSPVTVRVTLPATAWEFAAGHRISIHVSSTDALYQLQEAAAGYVVDVPGELSIPLLAGTISTTADGAASPLVLAGIVGVLVLGTVLLVAVAVRSRITRDRTRAKSPAGARSGAPVTPPVGVSTTALEVTGLTKAYSRGRKVVDDLSFTVGTGQVLGLLGPNGAGKTTALRMVVGLVRPDAGTVRIFGEDVTPGASVLSRVGCFIEGPGFMPYLSGKRNLELYWAASGRDPREARMAEALEIAGLGTAMNRSVRGYSQGMRQRLAIAQAMLGMPELLILDEPTNGLDPPQIHHMRGVLRDYAATGRTVIVSSHLLAEVEQTCSHVVIMTTGRVVGSGTVAELAGESGEVTIEVSDAAAAARALAVLSDLTVQQLSDHSIRVSSQDHDIEAILSILITTGVGVREVVHGRHLEQTFLEMVGS